MNTILVIALSAVFMALAVATPVELNEEQKTQTKQYIEECSKEITLTDEEKEKVKAKDFKDPTENLKCFSNCFFEKVGTLKDGVLQEDVFQKKLGSIIGEEKLREALDKCGAIKGENKCDTAAKLYQCFEPYNRSEIKA